MLELEPLINRKEYGWADIICTIGGVPVTGIVAIKYEEEQEKENVYGAGRHPVSRGYGRVKNISTNLLEKNYNKKDFTDIIKNIKNYDYLYFQALMQWKCFLKSYPITTLM